MRVRDIRRSRLVAALTASTAALAIAAAGAGLTGCAPPPRDPYSCGGQTIDRTAPVISAGDVVVAAPVPDVWAIHTDVASYPAWKSGVTYSERLDQGPFRAGSQFRWNNGGMPIVSTVRATETDTCTLWAGPSNGIDGVHLWTFTPVPGGTVVHTEESWRGAPVDANPAAARALLDKGLAVGRADLKQKVEAPSPHR